MVTGQVRRQHIYMPVMWHKTHCERQVSLAMWVDLLLHMCPAGAWCRYPAIWLPGPIGLPCVNG